MRTSDRKGFPENLEVDPLAKAQLSVLVVDDEPDIRLMLRYLLELDGHQVREATDGVQALSVLESEEIDVLITDLYMPRLNGFELMESVRNGGTVSRIVAMSGVLDYNVRLNVSEAESLLAAHAILDKPFTRLQLIQALALPRKNDP